MNLVGLTAVSLAFAIVLYAVFVEIAGTGVFLKLEVLRRFSLRAMFIYMTLMALLLGLGAWLAR